MKRKIVISILIMAFLLVGCGVEATAIPAPAPNPADIAMTMMVQKMDAEATQMAVGLQFTATAQMVGATATQQAYFVQATSTQQARFDAQATAEQNRRDAAATEQRKHDDAATEQARRDAEATAEQNRKNVIATATAQMQTTWVAATMQVMPTHAIWTQEAVAQEQIIATNQVELSNLEVERQRKSNTLDALWKYAVATAAMVAAVIVILRYSRVREIKNEETGVIEGLLVDGEKLIRPQLLTGPILTMNEDGPSVPRVADREEQMEVTRRAQAIEALRVMPTDKPNPNGAMMANSVFGGEAKAPVIEVLPANQVPRTILDELSDQVVEEE